MKTQKTTLVRPPLYVTAFIVGLAITVLVTWSSSSAQYNRIKQSFKYMVIENISPVYRSLEWSKETLENVGNFYLASQNVDSREFSEFTDINFRKHGIFNAISWISYNQADNSFRWEQIKSEKYMYLKDQPIPKETLAYATIQKAIAEKRTIYFIDTIEGALFGRARQPSAQEEYNLFIFHPVYRPDDNAMIGLAFSAIDFSYLLKEITERSDLSLYELQVTRPDQSGAPSLLYKTIGGEERWSTYSVNRQLSLSNEQLDFRFFPTKKYVYGVITKNPNLVFAILITLTISTSIYLRQISIFTGTLKAANKKAEEANRLKSEFLATMSHEIRTPMTGIIGMAELLLGSNPNRQQEGYARTIVNSGENLLNIINDILDFSKIEAGKMEFDPMAVNMLDIVEDIGTLYSVKAREKAVELVVHYAPGTEQFIFTDPVRIRQIISNLVGNAIKFTDKGYILLSVEEDRSSEIPEDKVNLLFKIKDTGIGIPSDNQDKLFQKFSQADASTTRKYGGTGLGLAICKNLVEMMGGRIWIESALGEGSTFSFILPCTRNRTEAIESADNASLENIKVIIVDDLPINLKIICEQLEPAGAHCDVALNGESALSKMTRAADNGNPYQMAIIDYLMPEMSGEMLACAIKDNPLLQDCCLVMLTAAGNPIASDTFAEKGFSAHLSKPIQQKILIDALSYVWKNYQAGYKNTMLRIDTQSMKRSNDLAPSIKGFRILLAEDNLVNQVFIHEIINEMECDLKIVQNGKEAVDAVQKERFDLILMDCLMPVMDGFEATKAICALKNDGIFIDKGVPIIALTANAMKGDREKCLNAGMDGYLTKPIRKKDLQESIYEWIGGGKKNEDRAEEGSESSSPTNIVPGNENNPPVLDTEAVNNARNILKLKYDDMLHFYIENSHERINEIKEAIKSNDTESIVRPAHTLKSTSSQMGALKLSEIAKNIEYTAKAIVKGESEGGKDMNSIIQSVKSLESTLSETTTAFKKISA